MLSLSRWHEAPYGRGLTPDIQRRIVQQEPCGLTLILNAGEGDTDGRAAEAGDIEACAVRLIGVEVCCTFPRFPAAPAPLRISISEHH